MTIDKFKNLRNLSLSDKEFGFTLISHITSNLDLTETQLSKLRTIYKAIGQYLAAQKGWLSDCYIYAQGSVGIGTSVKPIDDDSEMDIDLVLHLPKENYPVTTREARELLYRLIDVLQESPRYDGKIENEPKRRCVTLKYGSIEHQICHLDLTPSMPENMDDSSHKGNVRVADIKTANSPSHPYGFRTWFRTICNKEIRWSRKSNYRNKQELSAGTLEDLPGQVRKTVLQILVQLLKRHRDIWKRIPSNIYADFAPISIIITTLAALAYEKCADSTKEYENPFDLILDMLEEIPKLISTDYLNGVLIYTIANPALPSENFADKWSEKPILASAFNEWYQQAIDDIKSLLIFDEGIDVIINQTTRFFGKQASRGLTSKLADTLTERRARGLAAVSASGLGVVNSVEAKPVPKHNFFGD